MAPLTEHQGMSRESSRDVGQNLHDAGSSFGIRLDSRLMMARHQREQVAQGFNIAEEATSYCRSEVVEDDRWQPVAQYENGSNAQAASSAVVPESFEEQLVLAMAISLAEAQIRTNARGVARL